MNDIYLDNNATTAVYPEVVNAMLPYFTEQFGNPSSMHRFGDRVGRSIKHARQQVQAIFGTEHDSEVVFTSCGTESDSTAIWSAITAFPDRKEIITSAVEHPAVLTLCEYLEKQGFTIHRLGVDGKGRIDLDEYRRLLSPKVAIVTVMWANNETGTIFPVEQMADMAHQAGVLFHTDAVQAIGKLPIDLKKTKIDLLSLSGHKLHAPKGVGVLYVRRGTRFRPLLRGGHQERGRRAGTENSASIVGLGLACEIAQTKLEFENTVVKSMRDRLEQGIIDSVPHSFVMGDTDQRLPNTSNIAFEYVEGEAILLLLNSAGIAASSGSACTSGSLEPSHVMRAMSIPYTAAHGTIRFSLSCHNTKAEMDRVIEAMPPIIARLREMSPYWGKDGPIVDAADSFAPVYA